MKKLLSLLCALTLCLCLSFACVDTAFAGDLDYIQRYDVTVTPNVDDGSLRIQMDFQWEVLEQGPVTWLEIGIPNGSIRDVEALTDNIDSLDFDNSFMYVYFDRGYDDGEVIEFSYAWTQEYMYTLGEDFSVTYDYTPGWFDGAKIGEMTLTWHTPDTLDPAGISASAQQDKWSGSLDGNTAKYVGRDLEHGERFSISVRYPSWPTELLWEGSSENLPEDDWYYEDDYYYNDSGDDAVVGMLVTVIFVIAVVFVIASLTAANDGYAGGFGTRYVLWHGLWYPAGHDGRPRPGSVGTKHKPTPPRTSSNRRTGGGFGGGSRGGGFGGGGFGGGGHCACASSCACACACACAGGGRAGCSAKNLYGAVQLSRELTQQLTEE